MYNGGIITSNALINCRNETFDNMTLEVNIFNLQRYPVGFVIIEAPVLNLVEDSIFYDEFDDIFTANYESFLTDNEPEYDAFEFNGLYFLLNA